VFVFRQRELFWLGEPRLIIHLLQGAVFVAAACLAMLVQFLPPYLIFSDGEADRGLLDGPQGRQRLWIGLGLLAAFILSVAVLAASLRDVIPLYVVSTHIGELEDEALLRKAYRKAKAKVAARMAAVFGSPEL